MTRDEALALKAHFEDGGVILLPHVYDFDERIVVAASAYATDVTDDGEAVAFWYPDEISSFGCHCGACGADDLVCTKGDSVTHPDAWAVPLSIAEKIDPLHAHLLERAG